MLHLKHANVSWAAMAKEILATLGMRNAEPSPRTQCATWQWPWVRKVVCFPGPVPDGAASVPCHIFGGELERTVPFDAVFRPLETMAVAMKCQM